MRKTTTLLICLLFVAAWGATALAAPRGDLSRPHRYLPNARDGQLIEHVSPADGVVWATWAYRNGAEYDIAITMADADGIWAEPFFLGQNDGHDQIQPSMELDGNGNLYLAYAENGRIVLTELRRATGQWTTQFLTPGNAQQSMPALKIVGNKLIVAFQQGNGIEILDLPLIDYRTVNGTHTITDGPDPVGYTGGDEGQEDPSDRGSAEDESSNYRNEAIRPLDLAHGGSGN